MRRIILIVAALLVAGTALAGTLSGTLDPRLNFVRNSLATFVDVNGVLEVSAIGAPRWDFSAGVNQGLLIEKRRTNVFPNPRAEGASSGVLGSGGVMPTNWNSPLAVPSGVTTTIGAGLSVNGYPGVSFEFAGTPGAGATIQIQFGPSNVYAAASPSSVWAENMFVSLCSGSSSGISNVTLRIAGRTAAGASIGDNHDSPSILSSLTASPKKFANIATLSSSGTVAKVIGLLQITVGTSPIDATICVYAPQLELGSTVTSTILPPAGSPSSYTREADSISLSSLSPWFRANRGSIVVQGIIPALSNTGNGLVSIDDTTTANVVALGVASDGTLQATFAAGGVAASVASPSTTVSAGQSFTAALVWDGSGVTAVLNGVPGATAAYPGTPSPTQLLVGQSYFPGPAVEQENGYLTGLRIYPNKLSVAQLRGGK